MSNETIELNGETYTAVNPVNDYVLCRVIDEDMYKKLKGGLYVPNGSGHNSTKLQVVSCGNKVELPLNEGDYLEIVELMHVNYFMDANRDKMALIQSKYIAGVYRKAE